ncbi:hypothetical protein [Nocardioides houyundeii]|uniref:hypothetical protein n=1 Tax=Nocardioides houyundeii TaxID=2045452 RepID=UPI000C77D89F|nr:hypothetical protein [Nocardioides houyundeii]
MTGRWGGELARLDLRQPDQRSCGAAVLVLAEALGNERYARRLVAGGRPRFAAEVLAMHRRVTSAVDVAGRPQLPWWRAVGTPPWAVARQLSGRTGVPHVVRALWPHRRRRLLAAVRAAVLAGHPVPLYVGTSRLPRHVLLVTGAGPQPGDPLSVYDPALGRARRLRAQELVTGSLTQGWAVPWFVVLPAST